MFVQCLRNVKLLYRISILTEVSFFSATLHETSYKQIVNAPANTNQYKHFMMFLMEITIDL